MRSSRLLWISVAIARFQQAAHATFAPNSSTNFVTYWGQNSAGITGGPDQKRLSDYCANSSFNIINLAFLEQLTTPSLNFYGKSDYCGQGSSSSDLPSCENIGSDITTCQTKYGKSILLSIGGASYSEGGFPSSEDAIQTAQNIWTIFGPGEGRSASSNATSSSSATALRPFGSAVIDGFDIDIESPISYLVEFASTLRSLMDGTTSTIRTSTTSRRSSNTSALVTFNATSPMTTNSRRQFLLSAAPQCPYMDPNMRDLLTSSLPLLDFISVQFYNNECGLQSFSSTSVSSSNVSSSTFNFAQWDTWARTVSANPNVRVLLGAPGGPHAADTGYVSSQALAEIVQSVKQRYASSFGGVMIWDASQVSATPGIEEAVATSLRVNSRLPYRMIRRGRGEGRGRPMSWSA